MKQATEITRPEPSLGEHKKARPFRISRETRVKTPKKGAMLEFSGTIAAHAIVIERAMQCEV